MQPLLDFRKGDSDTALLAFFTLLGTTAAHTLLETARDALFLARLPASRLAWMILAIAACGLLLSRFDRGRAEHFSVWPLLLVAAGTGAIGAVLYVTVHAGLVIALYLWTGVAAAWIVLRFWLALGARFTISDGKRLFGFIGLGSVLGAVVGAACARALAFVIDARALVLAASALFLVTALGPARALARGDGGIREKGPERPPDAGYELRADPYAIRILALVLLGTVALTLVDYLFKAAAQTQFHQGELVAFFATASFVMSALALVVQVFGSGWLLRVIGVHRALLVLPVLVVLGASSFAATGTLAAALLMKGADGSLRHSLHRTSVELLFLPMADERRSRVKPLVDLVGQRGGQALASGAILLVAALEAPRAILGVAVVVLGAAWMAVTLDVRRHYLDIFRANLRESHLDPEATRGLESSAATPALIDLMLDAPEEEVRHRSLRELAHRHAEEPARRIPEVALSLAADRALRDAFASLEARVVLGREGGGEAPLLATLRERETEATSHLFRVLDLWHPHENFHRVHRGLRSEDPRTRASSRELCEHVVAPAIRGALLALIDDLSDEERLERASSHFPPSRLDAAGQLRILGFPSPAPSIPVPPFVGIDLRGRDFSNAVLAGADFTGADLRGCRLRGAVLNGAIFVGTRLTGADLTGAHLEDANVMGAQLERAVLEGARLSRSNWLGANARRAILSRCSGEEVRLTAADFEGADFGYANLRRCDMRSSDLRGARLDGANFEGSDFAAANLARATLRRARLPVVA